MKIRAVLFDLGETLFTYGRVNVNLIFREGGRLTYDFLKECASNPDQMVGFKSYYLRHLLSIRWHYLWSMVTRREFDCLGLLDKKARRMGLRLNSSQLEKLAALWYQPLGSVATVEPDVHQTLQVLQDMSLELAIISNTFLPPTVLDRHLERFDLLRFFPVRQYSSATIYRKPDRRIYQSTLETLNVAASETIMVGDKLIEDVKGPGKLGITGIFKRGITNNNKKIPSGVPEINHLAELPDLIRKL